MRSEQVTGLCFVQKVSNIIQIQGTNLNSIHLNLQLHTKWQNCTNKAYHLLLRELGKLVNNKKRKLNQTKKAED